MPFIKFGRWPTHRISDGPDGAARFVEQADNALTRLFDQVADDLIVKVVDLKRIGVLRSLLRATTSARTHLLPNDALAFILFLLLFEYQFDEELLKLLIAVIDAELFEAK